MIFCVEDDTSIREIEIYTLQSTGFEAMGFESGEELWKELQQQIPDLILLDIMLPNEDGVEILKKLKNASRTSQIPIIMATAKGTEYDKILSLDLGADDYIVKPFGMMEMVSRVRAVLRRTKKEDKKDKLRVGAVEMNMDSHTVRVDGSVVVLTLKEYELLHVMLENKGIVFTRDRLLDAVWGTEYYAETRTVDMHIKTLRQKLGTGGDIIKTVRGVGYRIEVDD